MLLFTSCSHAPPPASNTPPVPAPTPPNVLLIPSPTFLLPLLLPLLLPRTQYDEDPLVGGEFDVIKELLEKVAGAREAKTKVGRQQIEP